MKVCKKRGHQYSAERRQCPVCRLLSRRTSEAGRREQIRVQKRTWDANREKRKASARRNYLSHREAWAERTRNRRSANLEAYLANCRSYQQAHRERHNEHVAKYQKAHPEKHAEREARRRARKRASLIEPFSWVEWCAVVDFYGGLCAYCAQRPWEHKEHVVPLARGGAHALWNLVPSCKRCNYRKHTKTWAPLKRHPAMAEAA